jgi:hypothetical protein
MLSRTTQTNEPARCSVLLPVFAQLPQPLALLEWLETLVWPGQENRAEKLRAAIDVARSDPPRIIKGNLLTDLEPLIAMAPNGATLVVFHTAVLPYVASQQQGDRFAAMMRRGNAVWISNEGPGIFSFATTIALPPPKRGHFLMMVDGRPVAWTHPHGQSIDWFGTSY